PASPADVEAAMQAFRGEPQRLRLPTAPDQPVIVRPEPDRPQPRLDRNRGNGMTVSVGRLREGIRFIAMGHNTIRGAAGASVLNAELISSRNYL
ncbi:MAG TPA: Asd/ArgC dimerization domain-containing protein, partial [Methanoregulaceae archaeon]|nr:Asd/ArgC dimerization domain-containing protein [Methanoregulaceae archaeon]